jgi:hypothetical protein
VIKRLDNWLLLSATFGQKTGEVVVVPRTLVREEKGPKEAIVGIKFASDQGQGCMMIVFNYSKLHKLQATTTSHRIYSRLDLVSFRGQTYTSHHSYRLEEIYRRSSFAPFDTTATMASSIYNHHKFARAILKKSRKSEPSLTIELFTDHWKFKNSASS